MRQERIAKETLTNDRIEFDLRARIEIEHQSRSGYSIHSLIKYNGRFALVAWVLAAACFGIKHYAGCAILIAVGIAVLCIGLIPIIVKRYHTQNETKSKLQMVDQHQYRIVSDRLERVRHDASAYLQIKGDQGSEILEFARYGSYMIPYGPHYTWSKDCHMSAEGVFNTSVEGDKFYLVIMEDDERQKIVMIYNTKLFKLQDVDSFEWEDE